MSETFDELQKRLRECGYIDAYKMGGIESWDNDYYVVPPWMHGTREMEAWNGERWMKCGCEDRPVGSDRVHRKLNPAYVKVKVIETQII